MLVRPLVAAALAAGAAAASPAIAAANCVGERSVFFACVVTPAVGTGTRPLCVYAGGDTCKPVDVPVPTTEGSFGAYCEGSSACEIVSNLGVCVTDLLTCSVT